MIEEPLDKIVAIVNDEEVTASEVAEAEEGIKNQYSQSKQPLPLNTELHQQALNSIINQKLILGLAKVNKMTVNDKDFQEAEKNIASNNNLTVEELKKKVVEEGLNLELFEKRIKNQILTMQIQSSLLASIQITSQDMANYKKEHAKVLNRYNQYHLKTIIVPFKNPVSKTEIQKTKSQAIALLNKLRNKKISLAAAFKQYPSSQDLNWRSYDQIPSLFTQHIHHLKEGEFTGPLKAGNGFHLLKLVGKKTISDNKIKEVIKLKKLNEQMNKLKKQAYVKIL